MHKIHIFGERKNKNTHSIFIRKYNTGCKLKLKDGHNIQKEKIQ